MFPLDFKCHGGQPVWTWELISPFFMDQQCSLQPRHVTCRLISFPDQTSMWPLQKEKNKHLLHARHCEALSYLYPIG